MITAIFITEGTIRDLFASASPHIQIVTYSNKPQLSDNYLFWHALILLREPSRKYVCSEGGGVKAKAYAHYKIEHLSYYESVQGGGGKKTGKFERTLSGWSQASLSKYRGHLLERIITVMVLG